MYNSIYNNILFSNRYPLSHIFAQQKGNSHLKNIFKDTSISPFFDKKETELIEKQQYAGYIHNMQHSLHELRRHSRTLNEASEKLTNKHLTSFESMRTHTNSNQIEVDTLDGAIPGSFEVSVHEVAKTSSQTTASFSPYANFQSATGLNLSGSFSIMNNHDPTKSIDIALNNIGITSSSTVRDGFEKIRDYINANSSDFKASTVYHSGDISLSIDSTETGEISNFSIFDTHATYHWNVFEDHETITYEEGDWNNEGTTNAFYISGSTGYTFDPHTGIYETAGDTTGHLTFLEEQTLYEIANDGQTLLRLVTNGNGSYTTYTQEATKIVHHAKGTFSHITEGEFDEYTEGDRNEDGFWYERGAETPSDIDAFFQKGSYTHGSDAKYSIDGEELTSETNTVTFNEGYGTITFLEPTENLATIHVERDNDKIQSDITNFINEHNNMLSFLNQHNYYLRSDVFLNFNASVRHKRQDLEAIGISLKAEGQLKIDQQKLQMALNKDLKRVEKVFINSYHALASESFIRTDSILTTPHGVYASETISKHQPTHTPTLSYEAISKQYINSLLFENGFYLNEKY